MASDGEHVLELPIWLNTSATAISDRVIASHSSGGVH
jgi:hypothetical protein